MADGGKQPIFQIHIHNVREGDRNDARVENKTETTLISPNIDQLNITQQDEAPDHGMRRKQDGHRGFTSPCTESDGTALRNVDEHDKITQEVGAMNFSQPNPSLFEDSFNSKYSSFDTKESGNSNLCEILKGRATALCSQSKFLEAYSCLEKLTEMQGLDVNMMLLIIECSLQLGRERNIDKTINAVRRFFMSKPSDVVDVYKFASDLIDVESYVRAIFLLRISGDMYKLHPSLSTDSIVGEIFYKSFCKIDEVVTLMIESGDRLKLIALDYGLPYMIEMVDDLNAVENSDRDVKAEHVASCLNLIGFNYSLANDKEKSRKFRKSGIDVMERQFGPKASKYKIYGFLLNSLGNANYNLESYSVAEDCYMKAIAAKKDATDFDDDDEKQESIKNSENDLKDARARTK